MRSDRFVSRWIGVVLTVITVVGTLALAARGQLELYIHPRYVVFTVTLAVVGGAAAIAALVLGRSRDAADHDHADHDHGAHDHLSDDEPAPRAGWRAGLAVAGSALLVVAATVALLVLPPATLSIATAGNRDVAGAAGPTSGDATELAGANPESFSVKDWATLLSQGLGDQAVLGKRAAFSGFLVATDDPDVVLVARFLITCCAVDARPFSVPVAIPDWRAQYPEGSWVEVRGTFVASLDAAATHPILLTPAEVTAIEEPAQPYVY